MATVPQPAFAGSHVGVEVGSGGVYIGPRHRHYYDEDDGPGVIATMIGALGTIITAATTTGIR
jgi:hypothetical protein